MKKIVKRMSIMHAGSYTILVCGLICACFSIFLALANTYYFQSLGISGISFLNAANAARDVTLAVFFLSMFGCTFVEEILCG